MPKYKEAVFKPEKYKGFGIQYRKNRYGAVEAYVSYFGKVMASGKSKAEVTKTVRKMIDVFLKGKKRL